MITMLDATHKIISKVSYISCPWTQFSLCPAFSCLLNCTHKNITEFILTYWHESLKLGIWSHFSMFGRTVISRLFCVEQYQVWSKFLIYWLVLCKLMLISYINLILAKLGDACFKKTCVQCSHAWLCLSNWLAFTSDRLENISNPIWFQPNINSIPRIRSGNRKLKLLQKM